MTQTVTTLNVRFWGNRCDTGHSGGHNLTITPWLMKLFPSATQVVDYGSC